MKCPECNHEMKCYVINSYLRLYRKKAGITQEELALKSGLSQQTISELENNKYYPNLFTAYILADVLEEDVTRIFRWEEINV